MGSAFGVVHKMLYGGSVGAKEMAVATTKSVKRIRQPKLRRLEQHEAQGRAARTADQQAKAQGLAGADIHSRPRGGAGRKAWERGWNA